MNYEKKYYKFKNKYLKLKKEIELKQTNQMIGQMIGSSTYDEPEIKTIIVKNYDNKLGHYEINYTDYRDIVINDVETKDVNLIIKMTYAPDSQITISIDEKNARKVADKNELDITLNLSDKSTSNVKIIGVFSKQNQRIIKECLKKLLESSYTNQVPRQNDVLIAQTLIYNYANEEGVHPLIWIGEEL
jgi:hypothetical protein